MHDTGLIIGRFSPMHNGHLHLIEYALQNIDNLIIVIGSHNVAPNVRNPFTSHERQQLLLSTINSSDLNRVNFIFQEDYINSDNKWVATLNEKIKNIAEDPNKVCIFSHEKDRETYYKLMPQYYFRNVTALNTHLISATMIRQMFYLDHEPSLIFGIPDTTVKFLRDYKTLKHIEFKRLVEEFKLVETHKKQWDGTPYPVIFKAADALVVFKDSVLLIRRGRAPGQGQIAIPGGFLNQYEKIRDAAVRELREETNISLSFEEIQSCEIASKTFDAPSRSLRGRIISTCYLYDLNKFNEISTIAGDDAAEVFWLPIKNLEKYQAEFYADHYEIVMTMLEAMA